ncbi:MAG: Ig-like domain-containing protein [Rubrobacteraceae bacterium]
MLSLVSVARGVGIVSRNTAGFNRPNAGVGGGISSNGTVTLNDSTVDNNWADSSGGGITSFTNLSDRATTIRNSTVSLNTASGSTAEPRGGGIYNIRGLTRIENSTIAFNTTPTARGSGVASSGIANTSTEVLSSIISANANNNDVELVNSFGSTISFQSFQSFGHSLIGDGNATTAFHQLDDQTAVTKPGLGSLANNGGPTRTHALLAGSPAIDKALSCPPPATDQRGQTRPKDGDGNAFCDTGAFEKEAPPNAPPAANNDSYSVKEDKTLNVSAPGVLRNDRDPDGDALTARRVSGPSKGSLTLRANGSFTYKPKKNFNGADRFVYRVSDGRGGADTATVTRPR